MSTQYIEVTQDFPAPVAQVFAELTDHVKFGQLLNTKITRILDGERGFQNGLGSVRKISPAPFLSFEERVVKFEPNELMEYIVSRGSPIKNHVGRMEFSAIDNSKGQDHTRVHYTIRFEPKLSIPMLGGVLKKAIETPIKQGFNRLAKQYAQQGG